ncbi:FAD-dependent monooxygenase [Caballeronia sp. S22]|uniref:FAD-dependent monooxygenase n=1 Tax=Caballeronia sp. S22 TaxID=3137182 RepID=UPI003530C981
MTVETTAKEGAGPFASHGPAGRRIDTLAPMVDVLLVGCGPVGATIANLLARHGVNVMVVDKSTKVFEPPGVIELDEDALRVLRLAGIEKRDLETIAIPVAHVRPPSRHQFAEVDSLDSLDGHPKLKFYQSELERCLLARLRRYECARVALGVGLIGFALERDHVLARLDLGHRRTHVIRARYLVGSDGVNSLVRQFIGKEFERKTFAEERRLPDARRALHSSGLTVNAFSKGRVFLAGDAACITPPFVRRGLVEGLRDAANLSWKLAWVVQGRADARILDTYDQERQPRSKPMIKLARFMEKLVIPRHGVVAPWAHGLTRLLCRVPRLHLQIAEWQSKSNTASARGLFVKGRSPTKLVRGAVIAQGRIRGADEKTCLSDEVFGQGLVLIGFGTDARASLDSATAAALARAGGSIVQIARCGRRSDSWEDLDGVFLPHLVPVGWAAVVRPDKTVVHDGPATDAQRLVRESLSLLGQHCWLASEHDTAWGLKTAIHTA